MAAYKVFRRLGAALLLGALAGVPAGAADLVVIVSARNPVATLRADQVAEDLDAIGYIERSALDTSVHAVLVVQ